MIYTDEFDGLNRKIVLINRGDFLVEWSGLRDRNGVMIFEGDFIGNDESGWLERLGATATTLLVGFYQGAFMAGRRQDVPKAFDTYLWLLAEHMEVVGNRWDNPELLWAENWHKDDMPKAIFELDGERKQAELNQDGRVHCSFCGREVARQKIQVTDRCQCDAKVVDI